MTISERLISQYGNGGVSNYAQRYDAANWLDRVENAMGATGAFNVKLYGALGDGSTDDTSAIQAAIDATEATGRGATVFLPPGEYNISSVILLTEGVSLVGSGIGQLGVGANGFDGNTVIVWTGAAWDLTRAGLATSCMIRWQGAAGNTVIQGGGLENISLNGKQLVGMGVHCASTTKQLFSQVYISRCGFSGMTFDSSNGLLSQHNAVFSYTYVWGASTPSAAETSNGLRIGGGDTVAGTTSALTTQFFVYDIAGLVKDGDMVFMGGADNHQFFGLRGGVQSGGTGYSLRLSNEGGSARNNVFFYCGNKIKAESQTRGNHIYWMSSEGSTGGVSIDAGGQLHYAVTDYLNARHYETAKYTFDDDLDISTGDLINSSASLPAKALFAGIWYGYLNTNGGGNQLVWANVGKDKQWAVGTLTSFTVRYGLSAAGGGTDAIALRAQVHSSASGEPISTADFREIAGGIPIDVSSGLVNRIYEFTHTLASPIAYAEGDTISFAVGRTSGDAADTYTGDMTIFGASIHYESSGPQGAGSGSYDIPPHYV